MKTATGVYLFYCTWFVIAVTAVFRADLKCWRSINDFSVELFHWPLQICLYMLYVNSQIGKREWIFRQVKKEKKNIHLFLKKKNRHNRDSTTMCILKKHLLIIYTIVLFMACCLLLSILLQSSSKLQARDFVIGWLWIGALET